MVFIEEIVHIAGAFVCALIIRYMLGLSTPALDLYLLKHWYYRMVANWKRGQFEQVRYAYIARKLLDY